MRLFELQSNSIDDDLKKVAQGIGQTTPPVQPTDQQMSPMQQQSAEQSATGMEPPGGAPVDPGMEDPGQTANMPEQPLTGAETGEDDSLEIDRVKKVDSYVVSSVQSHPYVRDWAHDENSKINPFKIVQLPVDDLFQLRNLVRNKLNMIGMQDQFGLYDNDAVKFYQDMLSFVEATVTAKKQAIKDTPKKAAPKIKATKQEPSKVKPGQFKNKIKTESWGLFHVNRVTNEVVRFPFDQDVPREKALVEAKRLTQVETRSNWIVEARRI